MEGDNKMLETIIQQLNILIAIALDAVPDGDGKTTTERIGKLAGLGLTPAQIGAIIGKQANYVSAVLGQRRRNLKHA